MKYLQIMNEDEKRYICEVIPSDHVKDYVKKNPKEYVKIRPGFRASALKSSDASSFLYNNCSRPFIESFINKHIEMWLEEIKNHIEGLMEEGSSRIEAYVETFPNSYFANNVELYFKLIGEDISAEKAEVLSAASIIMSKREEQISRLEENQVSSEKEKEYKSTIAEKDADIRKVAGENKAIAKKIIKRERELARVSEERDKAKKEAEVISQAKLGLEKENKNLRTRIDDTEKKLAKRIKENGRLEEEIGKLQIALKDTEKLYEELKENIEATEEIIGSKHALRPLDIDQFKEFFSYNLESIGLEEDENETHLIVDYMSRVAFCGRPIVCNKYFAENIAMCIANSICGRKEYDKLIYHSGINRDNIVSFLNKTGRIVCLDGFIGSYDEMELINIVSCYKNKIVFLSMNYDRTMKFVPEEILSYCEYVNAVRIKELMRDNLLDEDPSMLEEADFGEENGGASDKVLRITEEILKQLDFSEQTMSAILSRIEDEESMDQQLLFSILPYTSIVKEQSPFLISRRLQRYAGETGPCKNKSTMLKWFGVDEKRDNK